MHNSFTADMSHSFAFSNFDGGLSNWDVSSVTDVSHMFAITNFHGDISKWDVSSKGHGHEGYVYGSEILSRWHLEVGRVKGC